MIGGAQNIFPSANLPRFNLDFADIVGNVGYVIYDGIRVTGTDTTLYMLLPTGGAESTLSPKWVRTSSVQGTPHTYTESQSNMDLDFDLSPYTLPVRVEGDFFCRFSVCGGTDSVNAITITITVRKWVPSTSTETDIASEATASFNLSASYYHRHFFTKITLPRTRFGVGDVLRVNFALTTTSGNYRALAHDPRDYEISPTNCDLIDTGGTKFLCAVPYKVDI